MQQPDPRRSRLWKTISGWLSVDDNVLDRTFTLPAPAGEDIDPYGPEQRAAGGGRAARTGASDRKTRPRQLRRRVRRTEPRGDDRLTADVDAVIQRVKAEFRVPPNRDLIVRQFRVGGPAGPRAAVIYLEGMADRDTINFSVLQPLMLLAPITTTVADVAAPAGGRTAGDAAGGAVPPAHELFAAAREALIPGNQVEEGQTFEKLVNGVLAGSTCVVLDGADRVLVVEAKGWEKRNVEPPKTEYVVRGPYEGFTETLRVNIAMVRRRLRTPGLVAEMQQIGTLSGTDVALLYVDGIANPALLHEARRRLKTIELDYAGDSGVIEQLIRDHPASIYPTVLATERPDRVASMLSEGYAAILVADSPFALVVPAPINTMTQTPEDAHLNWPFGAFMRIIRVFSIYLTQMLPAFYIAMTNYHQEMIPTDLVLAIAAGRERVPFPVVVEVLIMELSFELIREAGIRIPSVLGPTIGIVGALILGQAAVQAAIISPILVIIVAVTALASFTIPNYTFNFALRVLRFGYIVAASFLGFYGIAIFLFFNLTHMAAQKSFGVPSMAPMAPRWPGSRDVVVRRSPDTQEQRPGFLGPLDRRRQPRTTRRWDPATSTRGGVDDA